MPNLLKSSSIDLSSSSVDLFSSSTLDSKFLKNPILFILILTRLVPFLFLLLFHENSCVILYEHCTKPKTFAQLEVLLFIYSFCLVGFSCFDSEPQDPASCRPMQRGHLVSSQFKAGSHPSGGAASSAGRWDCTGRRLSPSLSVLCYSCGFLHHQWPDHCPVRWNHLWHHR